MSKVELLAPAGSMESLCGAVQAGANAVYLGGSKFSARAYASNFDEDNMKKAVDYCHLYGVKVYVTVNTLLKEDEIEEALEYAKFLYKTGVDALIIQDLGLFLKIRENIKGFELHASTQMTVHNKEGALFLNRLGFERIVLSRELSVEEIKDISKEVETEIFVHGALCICYSGQCLMSSIIGGRSGNRGRCAQPCRLPYTLIDRESMEEKKGYLLSPKDISTAGDIGSLIESGASSFKIEGRMKRPEYVSGVVDIYKRAIDKFEKHDKYDANKENKKLMQLFNREGFSKAYLFGNVGADMMAIRYPKNTGVFIGKVQKDLTVVLEEDIRLKDGVRNGKKGFTVSKIIKNGKEVEKASAKDRVKLLPSNYRSGDSLYKTSDTELLKGYEKYYKNQYERKIDLNLCVEFKVDSKIKLYTEYKGESFSIEGDVVQKAIKKPLDKERIIESLSKSSDTPFRFSNIEFKSYNEGFLPISALNEVRREIICKIEQHQLSHKEYINNKAEKTDNNNKPVEKQNALKNIIYINTKQQLKACIECGFENIVINPFIRTNNVRFKDIIEAGGKAYIKAPNIIKDEFNHIVEFIEKNKEDICGIITANLGIISRFKGEIDLIGDYKLNIFNSASMEFYSEFLNEACLSVELNKKEIKEVACKNKGFNQILIYGKDELMVSEFCPIGSFFGGKHENTNCAGACMKGDFVLKDRMGVEFKVITDKWCRSYIYNSLPTNLIPNLDEINKIGKASHRLDFIDESYSETLKVLEAYKSGKWKHSFEGYTRGHFKRGVE